MLTSVEVDGQQLNLKSPDSHNLFDIDSVSLIIGPNGSGKTRFIKCVIEHLGNRRGSLLEADCKLTFDHTYHFSEETIKSHGLLYYTPVRNQPTFKRQQNFINASNQRKQDIFELSQYDHLLADFDLTLEIFASLEFDYKKTSELIASLAIKPAHCHSDSPLDNLQYIRNLDRKTKEIRKNLSNLESHERDNNRAASERDLKYTENELTHLLSIAAEQIFRHFSSVGNYNKHSINAVYAAIQMMTRSTKYSERDIINLLEEYFPNPFFKKGNTAYKTNKPDTTYGLVEKTIYALNTYPFKEIERGLYRYRIDPKTDRDFFKSNEQHLFEISLPQMSSGQWAIFNQVISIHEGIREHNVKGRKKIIVFLDEGDAYLHLAWQRKYIWQLNKFLTECKEKFRLESLQLILASHSPLLTSDVPSEYICRLDKNERAASSSRIASNDEAFDNPHIPAFAAPLHSILNKSFGAVTIGEFAIRRINETIASLKKGKLTDQDRYLISIVDDPLIKEELERLIAVQQGI